MAKIIFEVDEKLKRGFSFICFKKNQTQKRILTEMLVEFIAFNREEEKWIKKNSKKRK